MRINSIVNGPLQAMVMEILTASHQMATDDEKLLDLT